MQAIFIKGVMGTDPLLEDGTRQVAVIGRSNVGKSSVINSLLARKNLVKSSSKPGKTTEINVFGVGEALYLIDLPGYGYAKLAPKHREKLRKMILWYLFEAPRADDRTVVLIIDAVVGLTDNDREMIIALQDDGQRLVVVANKFDKIPPSKRHKRLNELVAEVGAVEHLIPYSAEKHMGREELRQVLGIL